jgi:hypothetical protein
VPYDASLKANGRIQFVSTKVSKGSAPVRKVYEPQACTGAVDSKGMGIKEGGQMVEQRNLLCSSEFDDVVLFGKSLDGGSMELSLEVTLCTAPELGCTDAKAAAAYFGDKKFVTNLVFPKIKP